MEDEFDVVIYTPSSTLYYFAQGLRLNMAEFKIAILLKSVHSSDPIIGGVFTFTNALVQINKEHVGQSFVIELIQLPAELSDPNSFKKTNFPLWFASTTCVNERIYERTLVLLNTHHEPMYYLDKYDYTPENVEMHESHAKYLNQRHADIRSMDGFVPDKLVLYKNKLYMTSDFRKDVIDGIVTESKGIILIDLAYLADPKTYTLEPIPKSKYTTVPIFEFIEECQWISPYPPVKIPTDNYFSESTKRMTIVTSEYILCWYSTDHGAEIYTVDHCNKSEFLEAYDTIISHINKGVQEIGPRLESILHIYTRPNDKPDLTVYIIPEEYGGGVIVNNDVPEYLNENHSDTFDNYCHFDEDDEEDEYE